MSVTREEYRHALKLRRLPTHMAYRFGKTRLKSMRLQTGKLLTSGQRQRSEYLLHMALFAASSSVAPPRRTHKYDQFRFMTPAAFLRAAGHKCGTCSSLYMQSLVNRGLLPTTVEYLEIPPEIADSGRPVEAFAPEELWKLARPNYALMLAGKTGGDGHMIRRVTLDRFWRGFAKCRVARATRVLDTGCGEGRLLRIVRHKTPHAFGLELRPAGFAHNAHGAVRVKASRLQDASQAFGDMRFDLVILNLVLEWISDLPVAAASVRHLLARQGRAVVTLTPPEFTKSGQWVKRRGQFAWLTTKPVRTAPFLTMVNRLVGPVWYYPRSTADYLHFFGAAGMRCVDAQHIFTDTYTSPSELRGLLGEVPALVRHTMLPAFTVLEFSASDKAPGPPSHLT